MEVPWKCHGSSIEIQTANSQQTKATATDRPLLTPPLSSVGWSTTARFNNLEKKQTPPFLKMLSSQANFRNMFFALRSPQSEEVGVSQRHKHTDKNGNSFTDLAQRAESVKIY